MTMQEFLAGVITKAAADLAQAFLTLPEDQRDWSAGGGARTALDQMAECVLLTGYAADTVQTRHFLAEWLEAFSTAKAQVAAQPWDTLHAQLTSNAQRMADICRTVPDTALSEEVDMPWGKMTLSELLTYPYWNMTYHLGQINYIASVISVSGE